MANKQEPLVYIEVGAIKRLLQGHTRFATACLNPKPGRSVPLYIDPVDTMPDDLRSRLFALPLMNLLERGELLADLHAWLTPLLLKEVKSDGNDQSH